MEAHVKPAARWQKALALLLVALLTIFFYTVLHEAGHALVGLLAGQKLLVFDVSFLTSSPHVSMAGDLAPAQRTLQTAAGVGLPIVVWAAFMLAAPRRANPVLDALKFLGAMIVLNSALPWIVFPALVAAGRTPPPDDVLNFLSVSGVPPLLLTAAAAAVYVGGWALLAARIDGVRATLARLAGQGDALSGADLRRALRPLAAVLAVGFVGVVALSLGLGQTPDLLAPPPGYALAAEVNLSRQAYAAGSVCGFTLERPGEVGLYATLKGVDSPYLDIALEGPGGYRSRVWHGEGFTAGRASVNPKLQLEAGEYRVVITNKESPGTVAVYLKMPD